MIEDIRIWTDDAGASPAAQLRDLLDTLGWRGRRLGIELDSYGLTARNWDRLRQALAGFCQLSDISETTSRLRMVKSPAEMLYVTRAAALADDALDQAIDATAAGVNEGEILARMQAAVFRGGGDYPGNEFIIGAGDAARDKPSPEPVGMALSGSEIAAGPEVWFVGDNEIDMELAHECGCVPVLLGNGGHADGVFSDHPPALELDDCAALARLIGGR